MFSRRTAWDRTHNALSERIEALRRAGKPLIDLTESNPTRVGLEYPRELLELPVAVSYQPDPRGLLSAREALCRHLEKRHVRATPERLFLTASTSEAYAYLFKLLCDPGDEVLVPAPSYPLFDYLAGLEAVNAAHQPSERTRAALIVNPNNPTGAFLHRGELEQLVRTCADRGWALVSDEVFNEYGMGDDDSRVTDIAAFDWPALSFSLGGLSKSACLPQAKLSWMLVSGPDGLVREACERLELIADTYLSASGAVQLALGQILAAAPRVREQLRSRIARNRAALARAKTAAARWSLLDSEGGWYAVLRVPQEPSEDERCARLAEAGVLVQPGYFYDFPSGQHVVLSLIVKPDEFDRALPLLMAHLN